MGLHVRGRHAAKTAHTAALRNAPKHTKWVQPTSDRRKIIKQNIDSGTGERENSHNNLGFGGAEGKRGISRGGGVFGAVGERPEGTTQARAQNV